MNNTRSPGGAYGLFHADLQALSDTELLAAFLGSIRDKHKAITLAHRLMACYGDLRALLNSSLEAFCAASGINSSFYIQMQAVREMCRRSDWIHLQNQTALANIEETHVFLKRRLRDNRNETFAILFLNNHHQVLAYEELFHGTVNYATVHLRILVERTLHHNAAALILAHNHPSGISRPSAHDLTITKKLAKALQLIDVRLLDHLIIGDNEIYSIMQSGKKPCY